MRTAASIPFPRTVPTSTRPTRRVVERWPVGSYFVLTIAISWIAGLFVIGPRNLPMTPERFERLGPVIYVAILAGPTLASIVLSRVLDGRGGVRKLFSRLRWRIGLRYYALALVPPLVLAVLFLTTALVLPGHVPILFTADSKLGALLVIIAISILFGFFEELGWSAFATPRLLERHGVYATGLVIGLVWGAWHFPLFWERDSFSGALPLAILLVRLFSWLPGYRILMVSLQERSGSALVPMVTHAGLVATQLIFAQQPGGATELLLQLLILAATVWLMVAVLAAFRVSRAEVAGGTAARPYSAPPSPHTS